MKRKRLKPSEFTEEEMEFLLKRVEKGFVVTEKERINVSNAQVDTISKVVNGTYKQYYFKSKDKIADTEFKNRIIKSINEADDFCFECTGDYDDYTSVELVTYNLTPESDETYMERLKSEGRQIIILEEARLRKLRKSESRKVLVEKVKKKGRSVKNVSVQRPRFRVQYNRFQQI